MSKQEPLLIPQPRLGRVGMMALITSMNMVAPLSTDMYLPALPAMAEYFHTNDNVMNLTMVSFFFSFAIGMLIFGPVCDKYGRKPVLLSGVLLYLLGSLACCLAGTILILIAARVVQALGGGCMVAVSTAIVKDEFVGKAQSTVLAITQIFGVMAPMLAPIIGAWILHFFSWRVTFGVLSAIAGLMLILVSLMKEPLPVSKRLTGHVLHSFSHLGIVLKNRTFALFLGASIVLMVPMMAYISTSSYLYEDGFGLSATAYSYFFAANALVSALGPVLYIHVRRISPFRLMIGMFLVALVCGILLLLFGTRSPFAFLILFAPAMMMGSGMRPFSAGILLNIHRSDAGSASSLINFANSMAGTIGMVVVTALWSNYIIGIGTLILCAVAVGFLLLSLLRRLEGNRCLSHQGSSTNSTGQ